MKDHQDSEANKETISVASNLKNDVNDKYLIHIRSESYLQTHNIIGQDSGICHLLILMLVIIIVSDVIRIYQKFGVVYNPIVDFYFSVVPSLAYFKFIIFYIVLGISLVEIVYTCEKSKLHQRKGIITCFECLIIFTTCLGVPVLNNFYHPLPNKSYLLDPSFSCAIVLLKLISYILMNEVYSNKTAKPCVGNDFHAYRELLSRSNLYYFLLAPTLCYEPKYPRTEKFRPAFTIKKVIIGLLLFDLAILLQKQISTPIAKNCLEAYRLMDYSTLIAESLHLSFYNFVIWLIGFYAFFDCWLNILAEVLRFGDRCFYKDWWNSSTVEAFWRSWNVPVHRWAKLHIYGPLLPAGYSKITATLLVFTISGLFHEFMNFGIYQTFGTWLFFMMMGQGPLCLTSEFISSTNKLRAVYIILVILNCGLCPLNYCILYYNKTGKLLFPVGTQEYLD